LFNNHYYTIIALGDYKSVEKFAKNIFKQRHFLSFIIKMGKKKCELFKQKGHPTAITIPNSITRIGAMAFLDCTSLTSITIPIFRCI